MRAVVTVMLVLTFVAFAAASGRPALAEAGRAVPAVQETVTGDALAGPPAEDRDSAALRTMYVTLGAMSGYLFAVAPLTTTAVTAAVMSGVVSMWTYDYMYGPPAPAATPVAAR